MTGNQNFKNNNKNGRQVRVSILSCLLLGLAVTMCILMAQVGLEYPVIYTNILHSYDSAGLLWNPYTVSLFVTLAILFFFILFIYFLERNLPKKMLFIKINGKRYEYIEHYKNERDAELDANGLSILGFPVHIIYSEILNLFLLLKDGGAVDVQ
jgi:hypothetical protein